MIYSAGIMDVEVRDKMKGGKGSVTTTGNFDKCKNNL